MKAIFFSWSLVPKSASFSHHGRTLSFVSSLVAFPGFTFQTSKAQKIESFKTSKRTIRELRYELESLNQALNELRQVATDNETQSDSVKARHIIGELEAVCYSLLFVAAVKLADISEKSES